MTELEKKRKKTEIIRLNAAIAENEFKIEERLDEIERIKQNILLQQKRIEEITKELGG